MFRDKKDKPQSISNIKNLSTYNTQSFCRVYILKINKKFDILTILDQIVQTLFYSAIDLMAEETACKRSYKYRLHRKIHNNFTYLKLVLRLHTLTRRYILKADIEDFFTSVNHK